ncbi:MAG TPA: CopG family transcriptional regulator [Burkholderiales bacterium]|nr:CopG family transcriptional regulator [Burkholderiales bacterium]
MGQVTIYLDEQTEKKARAAARSEGVSLSKWVAKRIEARARSEWPAFVRELAGAWPDLRGTGRLRKSKRKDLPRERL